MATSGFFLILVGVVGIVAGFTKMRQSPSARHTNSRAHESGTPPPRENPGTVGSVGNVEKSQYNVSCPHCQSARVVGAKKLYFMYGFLLAAQYGSRVEVGCDGCLSRRVGAQLLKNLCFGWWSVPWGVLTPIVVLTNAWQWLAAPNESFTEEVLAKAGIDPEATRVGPDGLSGEQRRLIDPAVEMLRRAIHADAVVSPHEIQVAEEILTSLTGGVADTAGLRSRLLSTDEAPLDASILPADYRLLLLDAALDVVLADGHLAEEELRFLSSAVWFLQLPNAALEGALARRLGWTGGNRRGDAANARNAASDLTRALTVLGLQIGASWHQIRQAYRRAMLQYHPDRAGRHKQRQAEYTKRAQEINWAYKVCEAHYAAS
jgi:DnaJ-domain-containing protein 1